MVGNINQGLIKEVLEAGMKYPSPSLNTEESLNLLMTVNTSIHQHMYGRALPCSM